MALCFWQGPLLVDPRTPRPWTLTAGREKTISNRRAPGTEARDLMPTLMPIAISATTSRSSPSRPWHRLLAPQLSESVRGLEVVPGRGRRCRFRRTHDVGSQLLIALGVGFGSRLVGRRW